ncbi:hypothetical protein B0T21DRAFT_679 [Apiosordaria backusii]|uniref:Uncharacterized protein n=1 Tax=Apiosordaria backusii TaxID=314023 RepID=A0AA40EXB5_9PEZI|nr:hypothetical protein B0T21DRAFT_679 [Apiosordaria backusii]
MNRYDSYSSAFLLHLSLISYSRSFVYLPTHTGSSTQTRTSVELSYHSSTYAMATALGDAYLPTHLPISTMLHPIDRYLR